MEPDTYAFVANKISWLSCPLEIASALGVATSQVIEYIFIAIGKGLIRESDVFLILAKKYSSAEQIIENLSKLPANKIRDRVKHLVMQTLVPPLSNSADLDEVLLYIDYRRRQVYQADMYLFLTNLERNLHQRIKGILMIQFGRAETGWWKLGVPEAVRVKCAQAREIDGEFLAHAYSYTTFIQLKEIIRDKPAIFAPRLPAAIGKDMKAFYGQLDRLNGIRNQVMHPVREASPTEQDFEFVREMHERLNQAAWR